MTEEERLLRTIDSRDRRINRLVFALEEARAQGFVTQSERDPAIVLSLDAGSGVTAGTDKVLFDPEGHWGDFLTSAVAEAEKAMRKFPQPNYVISKVAEEAGEVVKAAIHCAEGRDTAENVRAEMRQLIAMLYRIWIEGDQVHGLPPISAALAAMKGT